MNILFVASQLYFPQLYGGVQTSTDQLCRALAGKGHKVSVLFKLMPGGWFGWKSRIKMQINRQFAGCKVSKDTGFGYPVWRTWFPEDAVSYVAAQEKADLIVLLSGAIVPIGLAAKKTGIPLLAQLHDVALQAQGGNFADLGRIPCVANSRFTAEKYRDAYGVTATVIYPFIAAELYRTQLAGANVTFINPHPRKGLDIALDIARRCPEIPFSFIEGWTLSAEQRRNLAQKLAALPNITLFPSQKDMRKIYSTCKILLAPSVCEEAYGRVAAEAQLSGIPVVASNRGGLPEAVGPGGILLDPDGPIEDWVAAVRRLWQDDAAYATLSAAALAHAGRPEMSFDWQIDAHEQALLAACNRQKSVL